jgi:hypothetical protein
VKTPAQQLDLFEPVAVGFEVGVYTSHVDGRAVWWAHRCRMLRDFDRPLFTSADHERAGPFATAAEAERHFPKARRIRR